MNDNYTKMLTSVKWDLDEKFRGLHTRENVLDMIRKFRSKRYRDKTGIQQQIVQCLLECNALTHYEEENGRGVLCRNKTSPAEITAAAEKYAVYAKRLYTSAEMEQQFFDGLYGVYKEYRSSSDYMTRLVRRRLSVLNPALIHENDTTRVLILKQFLSETDFLRHTPYYSRDFENYMRGIVGTAREDGTFDLSHITDSVFDVLESTPSENDETKMIQSKLLRALKYYGSIHPYEKEAYALLQAVFKKEVLLEKDGYASLPACFAKDVWELTLSDFAEDAEKETLLALEQALDTLRSARKSACDTALLADIAPEFRFFVLASAYADLALTEEEAEVLRALFPEKYLCEKKKRALTLGTILQTKLLTSLDHTAVQAWKENAQTAAAFLEQRLARSEKIIALKAPKGGLAKSASMIVEIADGHIPAYLTPKKFIDTKKKDLKALSETEASLRSIVHRILMDIHLPDAKEAEDVIYADVVMKQYLLDIFGRVYDRYNQSNKDFKKAQKKKEQKPCGEEALRMIDHLASGYFDQQKLTRENLYIFAIAFRMTFDGGQGAMIPETDIQKNLFYDYYADNFVNRFAENRGVRAETEVDGYGINFKNFAEMIFLYYIAKPTLSPAEKLKGAYEMIEACRGVKKGEAFGADRERYTKYYKETYLSELLHLPPKEFSAYLLEHYDCSNKTRAIRNSAETRTAEKLYRELLKRVRVMEDRVFRSELEQTVGRMTSEALFTEWEKEYMHENHCGACPRKEDGKECRDCAHYAECESLFVDYKHELTDKEIRDHVKDLKEKLKKRKKKELVRAMWELQRTSCTNEDERYVELMALLESELKESVSVIASEQQTGISVTRTALISLFYYYIILKMRNTVVFDDETEYSEEEDYELSEFTDFASYYEYCLKESVTVSIGEDTYIGLDECLSAAGYQQIHSKNLFDIFVIFFAFRNYYDLFFKMNNGD